MRTALRLFIAPAVVLLVWLAWPFFQSPEQQATRQHDKLVELAGKRYWSEVAALIADDFQDPWGHERDEAMQGVREAFRGFLALDLSWQPHGVSVRGETVVFTGDIRIEGSGAGASQFVISHINKLREPFIFTWRKDGWKPGDWRLIQVEQPELEDVAAGF